MSRIAILLFLSIAFSCSSCAQEPARYGIKVTDSYTHDRSAYTQGLFFYRDTLYESCGQYGESSFRKVNLADGRVLRRLNFDSEYFVEGSVVLDGRLYVLTWQEHKCFVYDASSWKYLGELYNFTEGWGLTTDGESLIMSDGSSMLYFLDPMTFLVRKKTEVKLGDKSVRFLNELEYIDGRVWANVYGSDQIVIINPDNGRVEGVVDCRNLLSRSLRTQTTDVLNGIACNPSDGSIYLTGKFWPRLYRIELVEK
ncbi:MAG: glutaminyl-peptide cyclotransferase [Bacteroidetes bacterium]|uniref:Glutaminyl-peptide cyclotransferase n=1 Tax=Candidatus Egerieousia excrementavium TaxID=2840778 RepID=A0A9D9GXJ1_9BACT|nr:glutaminyl-peptide cyclotransferase [Candidatus Egerieousia excrementavium]